MVFPSSESQRIPSSYANNMMLAWPGSEREASDDFFSDHKINCMKSLPFPPVAKSVRNRFKSAVK